MPHRPAFILAGILILAASSPLAAQDARFHVSISIGYDATRDTRLVDRSCDAAPLLNFFGCQPAEDGLQIGAPGNFGKSASTELGGGIRAFKWLRLEGAVAHRSSLNFDGNATFLDTGDLQPVTASAKSTAIVGRALLDLGVLVSIGPIEPFVGFGVGRSRNRISAVQYEFPGLAAQPALTTTLGGVHWAAAWDGAAGAAFRIGRHLLIEGAYRYSDLGKITTDNGAIDVVRGDRQRSIDGVAGTEARLRSNGFYLAVRQEF